MLNSEGRNSQRQPMTQELNYAIDMVMCIDTTSDMHLFINNLKSEALRLHSNLHLSMERKGKHMTDLRIKVISFRDYFADGPRAVRQSPFYTLPEQEMAFSEFVQTLDAQGGGDEPENGLEALALAIQSEWSKAGHKRREIVILWTDASAHPLEKGANEQPAGYPAKCPKTFDELTDLWEQGPMSTNARRLLLYAPDTEPWIQIANHWENVIHFPTRGGMGLSEIDINGILSTISESI